jgi:hypothetical protein
LYFHIYRELPLPSQNVLDALPSDIELRQRQVDIGGERVAIEPSYEKNCELARFLRQVSLVVSSKEKMEMWRARYAAEVAVVTKLDGCGMQPEDCVREALTTIFSVLSDEVHQASARFESDGSFLLPRASTVFTIPQIFAMASIVKDAGLTPKYPDAKDVIVL